jgi:hypothetical protein
MFFADPPSAFENLRGWLAAGGRVAFAVWGPVEDNAWMAATRAAVADAVAVPPADPDAPGPFRYADADPFVALLTRAGFHDVAVTRLARSAADRRWAAGAGGRALCARLVLVVRGAPDAGRPGRAGSRAAEPDGAIHAL